MPQFKRAIEGYRRFRKDILPDLADTYRNLAEEGQHPKIMVISCCDSRVTPETVFDMDPGELFVVRNIANLVPPYDPDGHIHSTNAAIEFAILGLGIPEIIIMGHAECGGITALDAVQQGKNSGLDFVPEWMKHAHGAFGKLDDLSENCCCDHQSALEKASLLNSLENLMTFPFVRERVLAGTLKLHTVYFDIAAGTLQIYDAELKDFVPV